MGDALPAQVIHTLQQLQKHHGAMYGAWHTHLEVLLQGTRVTAAQQCSELNIHWVTENLFILNDIHYMMLYVNIKPNMVI